MKGIRYELHYNAGTSVEYDDGAYELEEGDNPADNGDPISGILEHVANKQLGLLSVILDNNVSFFYGNALSSERAIASSKRRFLAPVVWLEATEDVRTIVLRKAARERGSI